MMMPSSIGRSSAPGKVRGYVLDCCGGKVGAHGFFLFFQRSLVFVDCSKCCQLVRSSRQGRG